MVFPDPVCADPMQSRPARMGGIHAACTGVGERIDMLLSERMRKGETPSPAKLSLLEVMVPYGQKTKGRLLTSTRTRYYVQRQGLMRNRPIAARAKYFIL